MIRASVLFCFLPLVGCGLDDQPAARSGLLNGGGTITDVRLSETDPVAVWRLAPAPALVLGHGDTDAHRLFRVTDALRVPAGIVVANAGTYELRMFSAGGEHLWSVGGEGGGPGEFRSLSSIWALPDGTIAAWDGELSRVTRVEPRGAFAGTWSLDTGSSPASIEAAGMTSDGSLILRHVPEMLGQRGQRTGVRRDTVVFRVYAPGGGDPRTIARAPATEVFFLDEGEVWGSTAVLFGATTPSVVAGNELIVGDGDSGEILVYGLDGAIRERFRILSLSRAITRDQERAARRHAMESLPPLPPSARWAVGARERRIEAAPARKTLPVFRDVKWDASGTLWIESAVLPEDTTSSWWGVDAEGRVVARLLVPTTLRVLEISSAHILGVSRDALDVEQVDLYAIIR